MKKLTTITTLILLGFNLFSQYNNTCIGNSFITFPDFWNPGEHFGSVEVEPFATCFLR